VWYLFVVRRMTTDLTSWKEIAATLGVNVRTAQKWERERQLPVAPFRRRAGERRADALQLWQAAQQNPASSNASGGPSGTVCLPRYGFSDQASPQHTLNSCVSTWTWSKWHCKSTLGLSQRLRGERRFTGQVCTRSAAS